MNPSKDFLKNKLEELFQKFDGVKIRYEFREYMNLHLIEVLPLETFEDNQAFILEEIEIQDEFESMYGDTEEILFISSDSLNEIKTVDFEFGYESIAVQVTKLISHSFSFSNFGALEFEKEHDNQYILAA